MSDLALRVRIGGDIKGLEKSLRDAEKAVKAASARLSNIGNELSLKLSLPMAAFGVAAIKAAGEIEAIEKAMQATFAGAGRSIQEANTELTALRKAAEAPGLDFEQAVKASLRLQGVGFSAEKARHTIIQLANAISTTGGTAENLNGVTVQFAQIISKGKILTSDLNVIKENMPGLAKLMKETFGTTSAEDLRALGVNGQEFVEKITAAMEKLPRVEGGISNAIVNAGVAVKMFLAEVGESLNKTFNITGKLEAFSSWLSSMGEKFGSMSESTQRAIVAVGVFALALGPMVKIAQAGIVAYGLWGQMMGAFRLALLQTTAAARAGTVAMIAMNNATKLTVIGAAIGVVLALAAAFVVLSGKTSDAAKAQEQLGIVEKMASNSVAEQMVRVNILTGILKNNVSSLDAKKRALNELNEIAPEYFNKLKIGGDITKDVTAASDAFRESLMKNARAMAAQEQLIAIEKQLNEIRLKRGTFSKDEKVALGMLGIATNTTTALEKQKKVLDELEAPLNAQRDLLAKIAEENTNVANTTKTVTDTASDTGGIDTRAKSWEDLMKSVHAADMAEKAIRGTMEYEDIKGASKPVDQIAGIKTPEASDPEFAAKFESGMARIKNAVNSASDSIKTDVEGIDVSMQRWADGFQQSIGEWPDRIGEALGALSGLSDAMAARNISNLNKEMEARLVGVKSGSAQELKIKEDFANKIEQVQRRAARRAKVLAVLMATIDAAQGVLKGLAQGFIPGAIAAGAIGAIQIAKIIATPLAKGGIVSGPTHALVGEYPGARNNPEVVAPLDKLKGMLGGTGSDVNVHGTFRVQGTDLLLVLEKAQRQRGRANGF